MKIRISLTDDIRIVNADHISLERVIISLVLFAKDVMTVGGELKIMTGNMTVDEVKARAMPGLSPGEFVVITISDNGPGMEQETLKGLFEPYSVSDRAESSDLGLPVVYGIIRQHDGWLHLTSEPGKGTSYSIYLPVQETQVLSIPDSEEVDVSALQGQGETILLVEDEGPVRELIAGMLEENGYHVCQAVSATDACRIFAREQDNIDLVFSDVALPGENGMSLAQNLTSYQENLPVLLASGYQSTHAEWQLIKDHGFVFLQKPFQLMEMLVSIREALKKMV